METMKKDLSKLKTSSVILIVSMSFDIWKITIFYIHPHLNSIRFLVKENKNIAFLFLSKKKTTNNNLNCLIFFQLRQRFASAWISLYCSFLQKDPLYFADEFCFLISFRLILLFFCKIFIKNYNLLNKFTIAKFNF